jgi:CheY-like chemotaxis protein
MPEPQPDTVLIALEEPMVVRILQHKLLREGHRVVTALRLDAMQRWLQQGVDIAIVGAAWTEHLGAPTAAPRVGWFVVTNAFDPPSAEHEAMRAGAAGVVRMPFKPTVVAAQVSTLLAAVRA